MALKDMKVAPLGAAEAHKEPDADNAGGASDNDADNVCPPGALEAFQEHAEAEKAGDDAGACVALCNLIRIVVASEKGEAEEGEE